MDLRDFITPAAERSASTPEMVAAVLREAILAGALAPRQPVRQDGVAARLGISKIPVREALRRLEAEGLVVFHPNRGVTVAPLSASESREIVEMRVALETLALRHAVPALGARDLRRAEALAAELEHEDDAARRSALNWDFHACLYGPADRPLLLDAVRGLHLRFDRYMRLVLSTLHHHPQSQREHRELLAACAARDVSAAVTILTAHVETAGTRVSDHLTELSQADVPASEGSEGDE
jgi:DNA-binding GntR family transcriptional regulator